MWERNCISSHRVSVGSFKMTELKTQTLIRASFSLLSCTDMSNHDLVWGGDRCLTQGGHGRWTSLQLPLRQGRKIQRGSISSVAQHKLLKITMVTQISAARFDSARTKKPLWYLWWKHSSWKWFQCWKWTIKPVRKSEWKLHILAQIYVYALTVWGCWGLSWLLCSLGGGVGWSTVSNMLLRWKITGLRRNTL